MLLAEPAELRGSGDSDLAVHLSTCGECSSIARRILERSRGLAADREPSSPEPLVVPSHEPRPRRGRRVAGGLAIAAMLAAVALVPWYARRGTPPVTPASSEAFTPSPGVSVSVPPGSNAIVFQTADPTITVVWYY
jgi:hypothetical protein